MGFYKNHEKNKKVLQGVIQIGENVVWRNIKKHRKNNEKINFSMTKELQSRTTNRKI